MSSLLAILLATHAEPGAPTLTFAYPPRPRPIPRLDRPIYKREQALAGEAVRDHRETRSSNGEDGSPSRAGSPNYMQTLDDDDLTGMRYIRGLRAPDGSSSEEDSPRFGALELEDFQEEQDNLKRAADHRQRRGEDNAPPVGEEDDSYVPPRSFYRHRSTTRSASRGRRDAREGDNKYLGFTPETWGGILTPRDGHGKKLEVVMDALAIIGHPVRVKRKIPPAASEGQNDRKRGRSRTRIGGSSKGESREPSTGSSKVAAPVGEPAEPVQATVPTTPKQGPVSQLTRMLAPSPQRDRQPSPGGASTASSHPPPTTSEPDVLSEADETSPTTTIPGPSRLPFAYSPFAPDQLPPQTDENPATSPSTATADVPTSPPSGNTLASFTLALVIDTPPASHLSQHLDVYYHDIVLKLTAALKRLERSNGYVSREAGRCREDGNAGASWAETLEKREKVSALNQELAIVFEDVKEFGHANATFDARLDLEVLLHQEYFDEDERIDGAEGIGWRREEMRLPNLGESTELVGSEGKYTHVQSWKTLLPLVEDTKQLAAQVAPDSLLYRFIDILTPSATLEEFQALLDADAASLAEMVDHLIYWRKAKLVDVVSVKHVYHLSPSSASRVVNFFTDFARDFPGFPPLPSILAQLSLHSQPFHTVLPSLDDRLDKSHSQAVLVWLLRHDLIDRVRTYIRILIRAEVKQRTRERTVRFQKSSQRTSEADEESVGASTSPETEARSLPRFADESRSPADPAVQIKFTSDAGPSSAGFDPSPLDAKAGESGFSLHPGRYPSGSSTSVSTSTGLTNLGASPGSSPSQSFGLGTSASAQRRQRRRWRQRSAQSAKSEDSSLVAMGSDPALAAAAEEDVEPSIVADPGRASGIERVWLDELSRDKPEAVKGAFSAVMRYFDGTFALEEIMSRTGLGRKAIKEVVAQYESDLLLLMHP